MSNYFEFLSKYDRLVLSKIERSVMEHTNRIVMITGGSMGIGKATAQMFRTNGDTVFSLAMEIDPEYPGFSYVCDITNEERVKEIVNEIGQKYGRIDVLVNNAGFGINGALEFVPSTTFDKVVDVNVRGAFLMTKYALAYMGRGSKIINISSVSGVFASPFRSMYCFSKSALLMMSLCQRMELEKAGIDVCAICPGEVKTGFMKKRVRIEETNEHYGKQVERAFKFLDKHDEGKRMAPEKIGKIIYKQSCKRKMKPMKILGFKFKLMYLAIKTFPLGMILRLTNKFMGGGTIE